MFNYPKNKDIVFVDIEANDKPKRLVQFGAIKLKVDGTVEEVNWFSNPKCKLSNHIKTILHHNIENINKGENNNKIMKRISKFVDGCVFISYSPFDFNFLNSLHNKLFNKKLNCYFIDIQNEWKKITLNKNVWALKKLANFFKIDNIDEQFHDALYDAKIMYNIFLKWKSANDVDLLSSVYKNKINNISLIRTKQNKNVNNSITLNNLQKVNGYVFLDFYFKTIKIGDQRERILVDLNVIEIQNNLLKRNWSFSVDANDKYFDMFVYQDKLINKLKQYIISIRNKIIVINDNVFQELIRLTNVCSRYIKVFPLNRVMFCNGFENFFNEIDFNDYKYQANLNLIKKWLVLNLLMEKFNLENN
ncbi:3'-5' exonuclease [Malacoplasma muris]|uniref:3'-5' exonuclease n=1 Tax=Malacoplasma muris TaxID=2119 RepID=UPI00398E7775